MALDSKVNLIANSISEVQGSTNVPANQFIAAPISSNPITNLIQGIISKIRKSDDSYQYKHFERAEDKTVSADAPNPQIKSVEIAAQSPRDISKHTVIEPVGEHVEGVPGAGRANGSGAMHIYNDSDGDLSVNFSHKDKQTTYELNQTNPTINIEKLPPITVITSVAIGVDLVDKPIELVTNKNTRQDFMFVFDKGMKDPREVFNMDNPKIVRDMDNSLKITSAMGNIRDMLNQSEVGIAEHAEQGHQHADPNIPSLEHNDEIKLS